jgi:2-methylcitrate dehydratase PrpD
MSTRRDYARIAEGLGKTFEVTLNSYKPFACGIVIHPAIDGCVQIKKEHGLTGAEVEKVELTVAPLVLELTGKRTPQTGLEGKFSVFHSCAVALLHGAAGEKQYADAVVRDPKTIALRDKVDAKIDPKIRDDEVYVRITLKDGRVVEKYIEHAIGSKEVPMTDAQLDEKFHVLADDILGADHAGRLIALTRSIETLGDAAEISRACLPQAQSRRRA